MSRLMLALRAIAMVAAVLGAPSLALAQNNTCPTATPGDNSNKCASTAFVRAAVAAPGLLQNFIFVGNASNLAAGVAMSGDCGIVAAGIVICTKTNGVNFASSATTDTTNASNISSGTLGLPRLSLTTAFFYVGNGSNNPAGVAMSGDCTLANTGAVNCTKTGGVAFAASATTDTTNASNISSGTLGLPRLALASGLFYVGNGSNNPAAVAMSGDCTLSSAGAINCLKTNNVAFGPLATQTAPCSIAQGCTGQGTAVAARQAAGLNIWGDVGTPHGDVGVTLGNTERFAYTNTAFTTSHAWVLPAAAITGASYAVQISDMVGGVTNINTLVITRAGADTVNGGTTATIAAAFGGYICYSDGVSKWLCLSMGPASAGGVSSVTIAAANPVTATGTCTITTSGSCSIGLNATITPQQRLTLTPGVSVMQSSVAGATTVYYTPYAGNLVPIYNGAAFVPTSFGEVSQATSDATKSPAVVANNSIYDIFCWVDTGPTNRCTRGPPWTNDSSRSAGSALIDPCSPGCGILVNSASITNGPAAQRGTWVGTIRSNGTATIDFQFGGVAACGTAADFKVWNTYNRVPFQTTVGDNTNTWTYTPGVTLTWREANGCTTMQVNSLHGANNDSFTATYYGISGGNASGATGVAGVGNNSTTTPCIGVLGFNNNITVDMAIPAQCDGFHTLGYSFIAAIETNPSTTAAATFIGDGAVTYVQSGLHASVWQ